MDRPYDLAHELWTKSTPYSTKKIREIPDKSMHLANGPLVLKNFHSSPRICSVLRIRGAILHFGRV
jgi:hypothetical protein